MKVNFLTSLVDKRDGQPITITEAISGEYIKNKDGSFFRNSEGQKVHETKDVALTLQRVVADAIGLPKQNENISVKERRDRSKLIDRIYDTPECEITVDEANLILEQVSSTYGTIVFSAVDKILNQTSA